MPAPSAQRLGCPQCLRPQNACICRWVCRIEHQVEVLVLQHPLEVHHPKGSAAIPFQFDLVECAIYSMI